MKTNKIKKKKIENDKSEKLLCKVIEIGDEYILFDNNYKLTYDHPKECCE